MIGEPNDKYCQIDRENKVIHFYASQVTYHEILGLYETLTRERKGKMVDCIFNVSSTSALKRKLRNNPDVLVTTQEIAWIIEGLYNDSSDAFYRDLRKSKNRDSVQDNNSELCDNQEDIIIKLKEVIGVISSIEDRESLINIEHATEQLKKSIELRKYVLGMEE